MLTDALGDRRALVPTSMFCLNQVGQAQSGNGELLSILRVGKAEH